jgi:hypothetical protein
VVLIILQKPLQPPLAKGRIFTPVIENIITCRADTMKSSG